MVEYRLLDTVKLAPIWGDTNPHSVDMTPEPVSKSNRGVVKVLGGSTTVTPMVKAPPQSSTIRDGQGSQGYSSTAPMSDPGLVSEMDGSDSYTQQHEYSTYNTTQLST